jgi:hypothetical protein
MRGKCPVAAVPGAGTVSGHDPEMVGPVRAQAAYSGRDVLRCVASLGLVGSYGTVIGRSSILETHSSAQSVRINRAVECGCMTRHVRCRIGRNGRRSHGGKSPVAAVPGATAVGGHDPEMICGVRAQATDVRRDVLRRVPCLGLIGCCGPVTGRCSILEAHSCVAPVGINRPVQCCAAAGYVTGRAGRHRRRCTGRYGWSGRRRRCSS